MPRSSPLVGEASSTLPAADRLIVALDVYRASEAYQIVDELEGLVSFFKVGYQLFIGEGMVLVKELKRRNKKVFLDLKMDDVEETIKLAVEGITKEGVDFITIHGNGATATAAKEGRGTSQFPKLLSLTLLSSLDEGDLRDMMVVHNDRGFKKLDDYVVWRAEQATKSGCDGLIASGTSVKILREKFGSKLLIVTPGIRPSGTNRDDHKRASTPQEAILAGADYLVVGRPVRNAPNKKAAAQGIIAEVDLAIKELSSR